MITDMICPDVIIASYASALAASTPSMLLDCKEEGMVTLCVLREKKMKSYEISKILEFLK